MIVYFSYPYAINDGVSQRHAITQLQKHIGRFKRMNPRLTAVNALMSAYDNPDLGSKNKIVTDDKMIFSAAKLLLDSSNMHVMIKAKGWEYDDIMRNECGYSLMYKKIPVIDEDPIDDTVQPNPPGM